jgi:hypothetical protein
MNRIFLFAITCGIFLSACETNVEKETGSKTDTAATADTSAQKEDFYTVSGDTLRFLEKGGIRLYALETVPEFMDAQLTQSAPEENKNFKDGKIDFAFEVKNYKLGDQTKKDGCGSCANSDKGQHIHFILNNAPYVALYKPEHKDTLEPGHYVQLAFLSRSYHIGLKHPGAYVLRQFTVGNSKAEKADLTAPHMFYSRPKGEYVGKDAEKVVLDFYLVNTDLNKDGNRVRATVNGQSFVITKWMPYIIEGLKKGEASIKLELLDKEMKPVKGPFNTVERKITVKEKAAA